MIVNTMENIGLHTYQQNFTVHLPFPGASEQPEVIGMNVYGILRAPRIAGTEAVVISVPYNQGNNKGALALMLSFADHCRSKLKHLICVQISFIVQVFCLELVQYSIFSINTFGALGTRLVMYS